MFKKTILSVVAIATLTTGAMAEDLLSGLNDTNKDNLIVSSLIIKEGLKINEANSTN